VKIDDILDLLHANGSPDNALLAQDQIAKLQGTPEHLGSNIRGHASRNLIELKHELDPEAGWTELVSVGMAPKGWIHTFIDKHYQLQKLFAKVCFMCHFVTKAQLPDMTLISQLRYICIVDVLTEMGSIPLTVDIQVSSSTPKRALGVRS
jgi:hypothetical protein